MKYQTLGILIAIALLNSACSSDRLTQDPGTENIYNGPILIWNLSQFELEELYTHAGNTFERGNELNANDNDNINVDGDCYCCCGCTQDNDCATDIEADTEAEAEAGAEKDECRPDNQLCEFLQPDATTVVQWRFSESISIVRDKTEGGLSLGLTTQTPPPFTSACSVLIVFDDGFRALVGIEQAESTPGFPGFPEEIDCP